MRVWGTICDVRGTIYDVRGEFGVNMLGPR